MQILIIGCGKVGSKLASSLSKQGHDIVIIDNNASSFNALPPDFNGLTVTGVPIDQDVLKRAGIETADALTAVTPDDNINIMVCQVAKEIFNVRTVIARIYNPEREHVFHQFGLDTICPTNMTVDTIIDILSEREISSSHIVFDNEILFAREPADAYVGKRIGEITLPDGKLLFGVMRGEELTLAKPDLEIQAGDRMIYAQHKKSKK